MPDVLPETILSKMNGFDPVQRVLLATTGTLQATLSAYFGEPVTIEVLLQTEKQHRHPGPPWVFEREVEMRAGERLVVCLAKSTVRTTNTQVREAVREKQLGIGQVLETLSIRPRFELLKTGTGDVFFWREYTLSGPGVDYSIRESFPKELYRCQTS